MGSHTSRRTDTRRVLDAIRHIVQALRTSARAAERRVGLSGAQLFVLHTLAAADGLALNDLAGRTHTHQSSVSTVVAGLAERGLLRRVRSAGDRRRLEISLTARGRTLAARAPDAAQTRLILAIDRLAAAHRRMLAETLQELAQALDAVGRIPPMFFEDARAAAEGGRRRG